jgi:hypothetical protein
VERASVAVRGAGAHHTVVRFESGPGALG